MKSLLLMIALSVSGPAVHASTSWGEEVSVGNGTLRTYVELNSKHQPMALGVALTMAALEGLPGEEHEYEYLLPLPETVCIPPFKHVGINWNPHGHEPQEIYGAPHFDFHFYTISQQKRETITCSGADEAVCMKQPTPEMLPQYYAPTPAGVPMMGWHWFDTRSPEFHGQPFTSTLIYGFYDGKVAFVEPMITREFLLSHGNVDADIPLPSKVADTGFYPTRYKVAYSSVQDTIYISLRQFTHMTGE